MHGIRSRAAAVASGALVSMAVLAIDPLSAQNKAGYTAYRPARNVGQPWSPDRNFV
jgi:hypothetical protein